MPQSVEPTSAGQVDEAGAAGDAGDRGAARSSRAPPGSTVRPRGRPAANAAAISALA
ncbi:MAG: hypothetical protein JNL82_28220 [Myxococcales bacterium]|nr:hypothetical protein [Myxococcales bacterium]